MKSNIIGKVAWAVLFLLGLFTIVDLGFGPIVICPRCGSVLNIVLGIVIMAVSAVAFITNRNAVAQR